MNLAVNPPDENQTNDSQASSGQTDDLADQLAEFDDSLQRGAQLPSAGQGDPLAAELESTILRLERHWPRGKRAFEATNDSADATLGQTAQIGRFQIQSEIGRGGFGVVFLALDPQLNRLVALKVPRPEALLDEEKQQRFANEAETAAALHHPMIVPIYEANPTGPTPYIVSAYCPGHDLGQWLVQHHRAESWSTAAALVAKLADGVHYAHTQGVTHRDIKPSNVLLVRKESVDLDSEEHREKDSLKEFEPRLTDFGLAKLAESSLHETRSSLMIGTPLYMAPEQLEGQIDPSLMPTIDIYALGCLLFELLTGQTPIDGTRYVEVLDKIRKQEPKRLRSLCPELPTDLETICQKCLEKEPQDRYSSALELRDDLGRLLAGESIRSKPATWRDRLRRWTRQPQRIAVAGWFTYGLQLLFIFWMASTLLLGLTVGSLPQGALSLILRDLTLVSCTVHLPLAWMGWRVAKGRLGFFGPATLASVLLVGVFVFSLTQKSVAFAHFYPTLHSKLSVFTGMILGSILQAGLYFLATPAWLRLRQSRK